MLISSSVLAKRIRSGATNPVVVVLLSGILLALVALIFVLINSGKQTGGTGQVGVPDPPRKQDGSEAKSPAVAEGQVARSDVPAEDRPKKINNPNRIKSTLQKGKTYHVVLKGGFDGQVVDKAWALKETVTLAYKAEMGLDRTIEENDGEQIIELRHFVSIRNIKVLAKLESVKIDLGLRGILVLGAIESVVPGTTQTLAMTQPLLEAVIGPFAQRAATDRMTKAVGHVDSLSGKKVRITYRDGMGVESIQPDGCTLTASERDFVMRTAVLSDCYLMPDLKIGPGEPWSVEGSELANFLDPTLRGFPSGHVEIVREDADVQKDGEQFAVLKIRRGVLTLNSSDSSHTRIGEFSPRGRLKYNLTEGFVKDADLAGRFDIEEVSTDHILFESRFETHPIMELQYSCKMQ
jgi:hypothetical protein